MSTQNLIDITPQAAEKVLGILKGGASPHFRIKIKGGGCSGFEYVFGLDDQINEQDFAQQVHIDNEFFMLLIDAISYQYVQDSKLDYMVDGNGERFVVTNPNAGLTCSCGSSFSLSDTER